MLPSETMIWQPEFTDKTLSRKPGAVHCKTKKDFNKIRQLKTRKNGIKKRLKILFFLSDTMSYCIF
ncbi:hypothetical protein BMT72_19485 [Escherichia coli]|uniref:hypothetical protein n=1 Tax=Escherichia coli TaxID=562 RepID=UPI0009848887|nr:hypothetical protein [Escherichia coli]OOI52898.1 hypothetical protein BMT75_19420 [Escherichia coli]OOJ45726.1 hypothetical protein BMT72_19485 [Escherichia coli]